jgi:hypothetical protein
MQYQPPEVPRRRFRPSRVAALLLAVVTCGVIVMGVPQREVTPEEAVARQTQRDLTTLVGEFRGALEEYRRDHGLWPGFVPYGNEEYGHPNEAQLERQLTMASDETGTVVPLIEVDYPYGPYMTDLPTNPINELPSVRILARGEQMPSEADGATGWVFDPATGELRLNATGVPDGTDQPYFDL